MVSDDDARVGAKHLGEHAVVAIGQRRVHHHHSPAHLTEGLKIRGELSRSRHLVAFRSMERVSIQYCFATRA
jgi:hypothetical protein